MQKSKIMKSRFIYPITLLALLAILAICGSFFFRYSPLEYKEQVAEDTQYTYLSRYVELSDYDEDFRNAASIIGYDWTLIAAIAYTESRFDSTAVSEAGACGVMQVMPNTLRGFNIPDSMHMNPQVNIMAATELLRALEKRYRYISNPKERINFVLASYNAGYGHIQDAMQLAKKHGKNRFVWNNSVDSFLIYKSKPEYYTDSICRNGQFTGWRETLSFVKKVNRNWKRFERMQQEYTDSINILVTNDSTKRIAQ